MKLSALSADTLRLSFFSFLMRAVGLVYNLWLTKTAGEEVIGLSQLVAILYSFGVTLSCSGVRLASTQLCTRALALRKDPRAVLWFCVLWGLISGTSAFGAMNLLSPFLAESVLNEASLSSAIRCSSFAIPFIAMTSAIYGYYTACGKILSLSLLQSAEQLFQMVLSLFCLKVVKPDNAFTLTAFLTSATAASELFSFGLACVFFPKTPGRSESYPLRISEFLRIVIPSNISAVTTSLLRTAQEICIPASLAAWGLKKSEALSLYGAVTGIVYPVIFFPSAILTSLSTVVIPHLTNAYALGDFKRIRHLSQKLLRLTIFFSIGCCVFLCEYGSDVASLISDNIKYRCLIALFSPLIPLSYLDLIVDSILRSIDKQLWATLCAVIDAFSSLVLVNLLVPHFGMQGLAASILTSKLLNLLLSIGMMIKELKFERNPLFPVFCSLISSFVALNFSLSVKIGTALGLFPKLFVFLLIYLMMLFTFKALTRRKEKLFT